jgi:hypothetical protein
MKTLHTKIGFMEIIIGGIQSFMLKIRLVNRRYTLIFSLSYLTFYIRLPTFGRTLDFSRWGYQWGFHYDRAVLVLCWADKIKYIYMPWKT